MKRIIACLLFSLLLITSCNHNDKEQLQLNIDATAVSGEIDLTRYSLGQGGLSSQPMIDAHIAQLQQLHPKIIRFFIQEYFNLYPAKGKYNWAILDKTLDAIVATGARPIPNICFKPTVLFPKLDQDIVFPTSYKEWDELVYQLVKHCNEKKYGIEYWELGNEVDIGELGGCPYRFKPGDYLIFYKHTSDAVLRADKNAKVGGPTLAYYINPIGDSLIAFCGKGNAPLDFFSWHGYNDDIDFFRKSIRYIHEKLARYPSLKNTETMITEWNMDIFNPDQSLYRQPAFILEMTKMFYDEGLSASAYYHICDYYVNPDEFISFMSKSNIENFTNMFNIMSYLGMYDSQGRVRPAYNVFLLLSQMKGQKLEVKGVKEDIRAISVLSGNWAYTIFWNYPANKKGKTYECTVNFTNIKDRGYRIIRINPESALYNIETLKFGNTVEFKTKPATFTLKPFDIVMVELRP
jgi:xylan 1,4-beta-xylosidase